MDISHRCPSCLSDTSGINPCPVCGCNKQNIPCQPQHIQPGTVLNRTYLIGKALGQGGFGITYLALDLNTGRKVAIKEYYPNGQVIRQGNIVLPTDETARVTLKRGGNLFFKEALLLSNFVSHPNIVNVLHFFRENNTAYIVMEYIDGHSLKEYLQMRGGKISFEETRQILCPIMRAVRDLHNAGLLHRDIAPDNIYLTTDGKVKLLDFGAARSGLLDETQNAALIIKPGYAPLEQYAGFKEQGTFTDIYALGATFYRSLTGVVPVPATDRAMGAILLSPIELGAAISPTANDAIMKAMGLQPETRYQRVDEMLIDIQQSGTEEKTPETAAFIPFLLSLRATGDSEKTMVVKHPVSQPSAPIPSTQSSPISKERQAAINRNPGSPTVPPKVPLRQTILLAGVCLLILLIALFSILQSGNSRSQVNGGQIAVETLVQSMRDEGK